jgi:hypothetical protein
VSQSNKFEINYLNYAVTDPNLEVEWSFGPNIFSEMITKSKYQDFVTLQPNSLRYNEKYNVNVTVVNRQNKLATQTITYEFTTGNLPPNGGSASMIPLTGTFAKTVFNLTISNWIVP